MDVTFLTVDCGTTDKAGAMFPGVLIDGVPHGDVLTGSVSFGAHDPVVTTVKFVLPSAPVLCVLDEDKEPDDWFEAPERRYDCDTMLLESELFKPWDKQDQPPTRLVIGMRRIDKVSGALWRVPWIELDGQRICKITSVTPHRDHCNRQWLTEIEFIAVPSVEILPYDEINRVLGKEPTAV